VQLIDREGATADEARPMRNEIDQDICRIVDDVADAGWSAHLGDAEAKLLAFALRGLFKMSAVEIIRRDVDAAFAPRAVSWELRPKYLLVRPADMPQSQVEYALYEKELTPHLLTETQDPGLPVLPAEKILFSEQQIPWSQWVAAWTNGHEITHGFPVEAVNERNSSSISTKQPATVA
jgi:hypothetical protein